jgi:hypothetical protein
MRVTTAASSENTRAPAVWRRRGFRRDATTLTLLWAHGVVEAAVYRRHTLLKSWRCDSPVPNLDVFQNALDDAIQAMEFAGTEVSLVLEHETFQHRPEQAPAISETAQRTFLKGLVARLQPPGEPLLWVSQPTHSARTERSVLLHLLPHSFYDQLNRVMLTRRLELTRIVPLVVPLWRVLEELPEAKAQPVVVAATAGGATVIVAGQAGHALLFSRCILATWHSDPARIGVELNRSLLYSKQQFGTAIKQVRLLGSASPQILAELTAKCGAGSEIACQPCAPGEWLRAVAEAPHQPVNLVAGYLRHRERQRFFRRAAIAAAGVALVFSLLDFAQGEQRWKQEQHRLAALREAEPQLRAEQERLAVRNALAAGRQQLVDGAEAAGLPPVPSRFAAFVAGALPANARLGAMSVRKRDEGPGWQVRLEGTLETDEESARETLAAFERQLEQCVFRMRIPNTGRGIAGVQPGGAFATEAVRFVLEGGLLED